MKRIVLLLACTLTAIAHAMEVKPFTTLFKDTNISIIQQQTQYGEIVKKKESDKIEERIMDKLEILSSKLEEQFNLIRQCSIINGSRKDIIEFYTAALFAENKRLNEFQLLNSKKEKNITLPALHPNINISVKDKAVCAIATVIGFIEENPNTYNSIQIPVHNPQDIELYIKTLMTVIQSEQALQSDSL